VKKIAISTIDFYRNYISIMKLPTCKFQPTCSQYAQEAIEKRGVLMGTLLSAKRILRCNPFTKGGYDPVE
jgi:putative membrane protein insertion efficiency factor